jgi:hypothetical protein
MSSHSERSWTLLLQVLHLPHCSGRSELGLSLEEGPACTPDTEWPLLKPLSTNGTPTWNEASCSLLSVGTNCFPFVECMSSNSILNAGMDLLCTGVDFPCLSVWAIINVWECRTNKMTAVHILSLFNVILEKQKWIQKPINCLNKG